MKQRTSKKEQSNQTDYKKALKIIPRRSILNLAKKGKQQDTLPAKRAEEE